MQKPTAIDGAMLDPEVKPYYFTLVTLQVEDTQYRVPRHCFEQESEYLRRVFRKSQAIDDGQALTFSDVKKEDLEQLLRVIFPARVLVEESLSVSQWISVLDVSASWRMSGVTEIALDKISNTNTSPDEWKAILDVSEKHKDVLQKARALAIQQLSPTLSQSEVDMIRLAQQYNVKEWLRRGLRDLVESPHISQEDQLELGYASKRKVVLLSAGGLARWLKISITLSGKSWRKQRWIDCSVGPCSSRGIVCMMIGANGDLVVVCLRLVDTTRHLQTATPVIGATVYNTQGTNRLCHGIHP